MASAVLPIPAYEPSAELPTLVDGLLAQALAVVVVNHGSRPAGNTLLQRLPPGAIQVEHLANLGKGRALKTGLACIRDHRPGLPVVTADADGRQRLDDILRVLRALRPGQGQIAPGSRRFEGDVPLKSRFGNALTRYVFSAATGLRLGDTQTGRRALSPSLIPLLEVSGERYEYELNVLLWAARWHIPVREMPIGTVYLAGNASSHFRPIVDAPHVYADIAHLAASSLLACGIDLARSWRCGR